MARIRRLFAFVLPGAAHMRDVAGMFGRAGEMAAEACKAVDKALGERSSGAETRNRDR